MTYALYWGDLHSHCSISYGHGTVEQALSRARGQLDFCSVTGHAFWPDMPTDRETYGEIIDYHHSGFARLAGNWERLLALQADACEPGRFVTFPSYEWHSLEYGDHNVYSPTAELPLADAPDLPALRKVVQTVGGIAIPHHIGYPAGYRGINWDEYRAEVSPFVEVFSLHGCSLADDSPYPMLHDMGPRDFGSTAEAGWRRGHRFGVVGGTDHHAAYPGSHGDGRMGVFAGELTREALWEAFENRRVFAVTGDRIDARMFLNGAGIGECVAAAGERRIQIAVRGSDAIDKVELLKNSRIAARFFPEISGVDDAPRRFRLRLTWGWGRKTEAVRWEGRLRLSEGTITQIETCFSGQPIVAPKGSGDVVEPIDDDLPHELIETETARCAWRSITRGNPTMRHATTQALSLEIEAPLTARLTVEVNGRKFAHPLEELLHAARSHFLRGWLSEAIRIGPLVPVAECTVNAEYRDEPEQDVDVYRLQVAQRNGQWAWLTPVWVER